MPRTSSIVDQAAFYEAALEGLELQKQRIEEQIRQVRSLIGGRKSAPVAAPAAAGGAPVAAPAKNKPGRKTRKKRTLSPEARARIAEAQKKRWAAFHKTGGKA